MTSATSLPVFNIVSSTHIMSVICSCFQCVPEDKQIQLLEGVWSSRAAERYAERHSLAHMYGAVA